MKHFIGQPSYGIQSFTPKVKRNPPPPTGP